jgi:hypothetical protein
MIGLLIRGFFLLGIVSWYSSGVWKFIDDYFKYEYKKYLTHEFKRNKNLQPVNEITTQLPPPVALEKLNELCPNDLIPLGDNVQVKNCDKNLCHSPKKLDYHNQQQTNDRQSEDDDGFINYWLEQRSKDNTDNNLYCQPREAKCEDN